jgi:hypothetical protein
MAARLKRHIQCGALSLFPCLPDRENFCVRSPRSEMKTLPDDSTLTNHDGSYHRIRTCRSLALRRETKRQGHIVEIWCAGRHRFLRLPESVLGAGLVRFTGFDTFADFTVLTRAVAVFLDSAGGLASASAIATRNGEQLT